MRLSYAHFFLVAVTSFSAIAFDQAAGEVRDSVVRIEVTSRGPDLARPWLRRSPTRSSGTGVVIEGGKILTNAHVVRYASQIEVQPSDASEKLVATVEVIAPGIDLALLSVERQGAIDRLPPLPFAEELPQLKQQISVLGYPVGGKDLSVTEGVVSRIEFAKMYYDARGLRIQVDAALNPGNSGGPAISDDKMVGLVFSGIREADNIGYLIAIEEIEAFLADVEDGVYDGKPTVALGGGANRLENQALRDSLGVAEEVSGVVVHKVLSKLPDGLWPNDVITHVGKHNIDNQGNVLFGDHLRLNFNYFLDKVVQDNRVPMTVIRNGEQQELRVPVDQGVSRVIKPLKHQYPEYFIWGPVAFTAASAELARGGNRKVWELFYLSNNPMLGRLQEWQPTPTKEIVIIPNRMFPSRISRGYDAILMAVVESVNRVPVVNLAHLVELLRDSQDEFIRIELAGYYSPLVFRRSEAEAITEQILTDEGIRYRASESLRKIWEKKQVGTGSAVIEHKEHKDT